MSELTPEQMTANFQKLLDRQSKCWNPKDYPMDSAHALTAMREGNIVEASANRRFYKGVLEERLDGKGDRISGIKVWDDVYAYWDYIRSSETSIFLLSYFRIASTDDLPEGAIDG